MVIAYDFCRFCFYYFNGLNSMTSSLGFSFTNELINNVAFDRFELLGSHINFKVQHIE